MSEYNFGAWSKTSHGHDRLQPFLRILDKINNWEKSRHQGLTVPFSSLSFAEKFNGAYTDPFMMQLAATQPPIQQYNALKPQSHDLPQPRVTVPQSGE